jgi:hypothetical protein
MPAKQTWTFKPRLRSRAFGWNGSHLACQRLKEAAGEIKTVAREDPVTTAEGVVCLMERIWPAFQGIDTSSGAPGGAVEWAQNELKTRDKWLDCVWQAIEDDGVDYLSAVEDRWGELCHSREAASRWADKLLSLPRTDWTDPQPVGYVRVSSVCLSSLVAAGPHREILELLALRRFPNWPDRKFAVQSPLAEGHMDEALAYAEASRGLNQPDSAIDAACEKILLDGGRWFAAAKDCGFLDLALAFANKGRTDPRTLSRASRDFLYKDARFALQVGRLALRRILEGYGYVLTAVDVIDAYNHFMAVARKLEIVAQACNDVLAMAAKAQQGGVAFSDILTRQCSYDPQVSAATPYIVLHPGPNDWFAYFGRTLPEPTPVRDYARHMKYGPTRQYWNDYVFEAYVNHRTEAIYLAGLPDVPESRPHSQVNEWGFGGGSTNRHYWECEQCLWTT